MREVLAVAFRVGESYNGYVRHNHYTER
jgi:hypothetical protein